MPAGRRRNGVGRSKTASDHAHSNRLPKLRTRRRYHRVASERAYLFTVRTRRAHQKRQASEVSDRYAGRPGHRARRLELMSTGGLLSVHFQFIYRTINLHSVGGHCQGGRYEDPRIDSACVGSARDGRHPGVHE
jgi:hypothetical protein